MGHQVDDLPGEPSCPEDGTVLRVDELGWVCGWCGHREPFDDVTMPDVSDVRSIRGG